MICQQKRLLTGFGAERVLYMFNKCNSLGKPLATSCSPFQTHRALSQTPSPPCAQSPVWWSARPGGGRFHSTGPRELFPHVHAHSEKAWCQRLPPISWVSHTAGRTPLPYSLLYGDLQVPDLSCEAPVGFLLDTTGVHIPLKYDRKNIYCFDSSRFILPFHIHSSANCTTHLKCRNIELVRNSCLQLNSYLTATDQNDYINQGTNWSFRICSLSTFLNI